MDPGTGIGDRTGEPYRRDQIARQPWLPRSHVLAILIGLLAISGFTVYLVHANYVSTLGRWRSDLGATVRYQEWTLENSLQQSQDDARLLAGFASTRSLLLAQANGASSGLPKTQVLALFAEYRQIYEYGALYLFDDQARVVAETTDSGPWSGVIGSEGFKDNFRSVMRTGLFAVAIRESLNQQLALVFLMPVFADPAAGALTKSFASPIGVVVIADLLSRDLQPLLTAGSLVTRTGETILVQLGAGGGRFLSSGSRPARGGFVSDALLRAASSAAASSGNDKRSPLLQFVDYRGVNVVASIKKIPSLNSVVIFKVDRDEALAAFRRVLPLEGLTALSVFLMYFGLIVMFNRFAVAREMRLTLAQQGLENQRLETKVAERTGELKRTNEQLHRELAERLSAEAGLAEKIEMLNRAEIERESLVTSLERALSEKIVLLKEVHHRVKNNMAVVAGLLAMQAEKVDDDADRSALEDSRQRVLSMALIHESLYATEHLDRVNFGAYVHQLCTGLFGTFSKLASLIELDIQAEEIDLPVDRAIPCGLILNELLSNALKHAFPKGRRGKIRIQFQRLPSGEFLLSCQDDGVGIAPDFDWQHAHSLGLKIIGILAKQIDGAFTLSRVDGKTLFELRVPAIAGR